MNIADILGKVVDKLNDDSSCDLCWRLVLGGRDDYFNNERDSSMECDCEDCCVRVGALNIENTFGYQDNDYGVTKLYNDWNLTLFAGIASGIDLQFYNEVNPSDCENSKWSKYIHPVQCCIENMDADICEMHSCSGEETTIEIRSWKMVMKMNYTDRNLDGWRITATIREWIS